MRLNLTKDAWTHPDLNQELDTEQLYKLSYNYLIKFLPFFKNTAEGSIKSGVDIQFSKRMRRILGSADLRDNRIILNQKYFEKNTVLLPYTFFHELTHLWLYHCGFDPGHTARFYQKMQEFEQTGLPLDTQVHIHKRKATEGKFVYICPKCQFRWHQTFKSKYKSYCEYCEQQHGEKFYPELHPFFRPAKSLR